MWLRSLFRRPFFVQSKGVEGLLKLVVAISRGLRGPIWAYLGGAQVYSGKIEAHFGHIQKLFSGMLGPCWFIDVLDAYCSPFDSITEVLGPLLQQLCS